MTFLPSLSVSDTSNALLLGLGEEVALGGNGKKERNKHTLGLKVVNKYRMNAIIEQDATASCFTV